MPILRSLLLLVVLFTPALAQDGARAAAGAKDAAQALQVYLDGVAKSGQRPDYTKPPAADLFRQVFDLAQLTALPPPEASDMSWVLDWFDAVKETYKRIMFFGTEFRPDFDQAAVLRNMTEYEDQHAAALSFMLRLMAREATTSFLFMDQLTPEERTPIREAGLQKFRAGGAQMIADAICPVEAGTMRPANARLITTAMRDTRDVWAKFILPNDRPCSPGHKTRLRTMRSGKILLSLPTAFPLSKTNSPASAGSSEDEAVFGETLKRIATAKPEKGGKSKG